MLTLPHRLYYVRSMADDAGGVHQWHGWHGSFKSRIESNSSSLTRTLPECPRNLRRDIEESRVGCAICGEYLERSQRTLLMSYSRVPSDNKGPLVRAARK